MGRAGQFHLQRRNPAQTVGEGRLIRTRHIGVGNHRHIALQLLLSRPQHRLQVVASHFLFPFHHKHHVGCRSAFPDRLGHAQHMGKNLSLVIGGSPRQHHSVQHPRLKRVARPSIPDLRGLHIIMPVDQDPPPFSNPRLAPLCQHHRGPRRGHNLRLQPHLSKLLLQPGGTVPHRRLPCRIGRNRGEPKKIEIVGAIFLRNGHGGILPDPHPPHQPRGSFCDPGFARFLLFVMILP